MFSAEQRASHKCDWTDSTALQLFPLIVYVYSTGNTNHLAGKLSLLVLFLFNAFLKLLPCVYTAQHVVRGFLFTLCLNIQLCIYVGRPSHCGGFSPQVSRILYSFATAFRRSAKRAVLSSQQAPPLTPDSDLFTFTVSLEIREDDGKGTFRWDSNSVVCSNL